MSRLWIPRTPELRAAAIEQALMMHDVDFWRMWRRLGSASLAGPAGAGGPGNPVPPEVSSSSSSSSSSSDPCEFCGCTDTPQFTVSGVTGSSPCTSFNRSWSLTNTGSVGGTPPHGTGSLCRYWRESPITGGGTLSAHMYEFDNAPCTVWLVFYAAGGMTGTLYASYSCVDFTCGVANTFNLQSSGACGNWPSTLSAS